MNKKTLIPKITLDFPSGEALKAGELKKAQITITNGTLEPIIIQAVDLEGQLPALRRGLQSLPGSLREKKATGQFVYDPAAPGRTPEVFTDSLLLPGEQWTIEAMVRLRSPRQPVVLEYHTMTLPELLDSVFFPEGDPQRSRRLRYRRLTATRLESFRQAEPGTLERTVVIPDPGDSDIGWLETIAQSCPVSLEDPETIEAIRIKAGAPPHAIISFWSREFLWIINDPGTGETFGLKDDGSREALPPCEAAIFDLYDHLPPNQPIAVIDGETGEREDRTTPFGARLFFNKVQASKARILVDWVESEDGGLEHGLYLELPGNPDTGFSVDDDVRNNLPETTTSQQPK